MNRNIQNKGITLIALVVTIIVLLILAGITISLVIGQNGIITRANYAKLENRAGAVQDEIEIWKMETEIDKYSNPLARKEEEMLSDLKNKKLVYDEEVNTSNKTITIGTRVISYAIENNLKTQKVSDINGNVYTIYYEEGMTWEQFIDSKYNTINLYYTEIHFYFQDGMGCIINKAKQDVKKTELILEDEIYTSRELT